MAGLLFKGWLGRSILSFVGVVLLCGSQGVALPALAQSLPLAIRPLHFEFDASPGAVLSGKLMFWNGSAGPLPVAVEVADFQPQGEEGHVAVGAAEADANSLKSWVKPSEPGIVINPASEATLDFFILVPPSAEPGTHWGTIVARAASSGEGAGSAIEVKLAALLLVRVSGAVTEKLALDSFGAPLLSVSPPVLAARFRNEGNVHTAPRVFVSVRNMWGDEVATSTPPAWNVLPGAVRKFESSLDDGFIWLGPYTASLQATYGSGEIITSKTRFWVVPLAVWEGVIVLAALWILFKMRRRFAAAWRVILGK